MGKKRNLYLKTIPVEEAKEKYMAVIEGIIEPEYETIDVREALDRITGQIGKAHV